MLKHPAAGGEAANAHKGPVIPADDSPTSSTSATPTTTNTSQNTAAGANQEGASNDSSDTGSRTDVCSASSPGSREQALEDFAESILNFDGATLTPY